MAIVQAPRAVSITAPPRASRDTGIDFLRALCVLGVVLLHAIMVGVTVTDSGPVFANASDGTGWIAPLSWFLQVMPLFFVIGGFSGLLAYRRMRQRGGTAVGFVAGRVHRLLRPAIFTISVIALALALLTVFGVPADLIATAGFRYGQPLWFLGVFLLCQALLPVLASAHERAPLRTIVALTLASIAVDVLRAATGLDGLGFLNLAFVWMTLQQLGFFLADGRIDRLRRRVRATAGITALLLLIATFAFGIYSPDLIANINPPTAALLLVGVVHTSLLSLHRERLERFSRRPRVAAFTGFVTVRTMTIYLWHMPVLLLMAGVTAVYALVTGAGLPEVDSADWWAGRPLWLATALILTALAAVAFTRFESQAAPAATTSTRRIVIGTLSGLVGIVLLLALGTSVATALIAIALIGASLRLSSLSGFQRSTPRPPTTVRVPAPA
ncbi:acyltransferase [Microbacterium sp. NPDC091662]|uniref:acyltransferase family protein n=1 Tax=Microbacterium sp. NPDC091662 TaxID=3364211 RepID=UPI0037F7606C